jgi:hypothetical protein
MLAVDFGSGCEFGLVLGFKSLLAVPPGAAAIEVIPNIRRADDCHFSPQRTLHLHPVRAGSLPGREGLQALQVSTRRILM